MPWKASSVMDERLRFVARLLEGEQMSLLCRELGISRKTGYKIFERYRTCQEFCVWAVNDIAVLSAARPESAPRNEWRTGSSPPAIPWVAFSSRV